MWPAGMSNVAWRNDRVMGRYLWCERRRVSSLVRATPDANNCGRSVLHSIPRRCTKSQQMVRMSDIEFMGGAHQPPSG